MSLSAVIVNAEISIGKGVVSGLQEALADLELNATAASVSTAIGVSLSALSSPGAAVVVSILTFIAGIIGTIQIRFMIAQAVGDIQYRYRDGNLERVFKGGTKLRNGYEFGKLSVDSEEIQLKALKAAGSKAD